MKGRLHTSRIRWFRVLLGFWWRSALEMEFGHSRGTTIATLALSQFPLLLALTSTNSRSIADLLAESVRPAEP